MIALELLPGDYFTLRVPTVERPVTVWKYTGQRKGKGAYDRGEVYEVNAEDGNGTTLHLRPNTEVYLSAPYEAPVMTDEEVHRRAHAPEPLPLKVAALVTLALSALIAAIGYAISIH